MSLTLAPPLLSHRLARAVGHQGEAGATLEVAVTPGPYRRRRSTTYRPPPPEPYPAMVTVPRLPAIPCRRANSSLHPSPSSGPWSGIRRWDSYPPDRLMPGAEIFSFFGPGENRKASGDGTSPQFIKQQNPAGKPRFQGRFRSFSVGPLLPLGPALIVASWSP
jgi:hypothetical protein